MTPEQIAEWWAKAHPEDRKRLCELIGEHWTGNLWYLSPYFGVHSDHWPASYCNKKG